ncbi:nucleotidyltransferase family protein [Ramlibacter sp. WS9]|uniref:nucleotidyltransferase family protein n=1 Tax=Ramlibacter sp. WS9 TaxID=1882741 RepID=UPI0011411A4F|nr:nucleotidyltransferase family protein [Ramlibacter sp. WS9]ROZ64431.1 nucleotidyltransferase family protein [Ramlibacter sp. WS9]
MTGARAMIMAAGRGERMRPLTDDCPKPLLKVRGKPLIQYHMEALKTGDVGRVVINTAWLGEQIEHFATTTEGLPEVAWSREGQDFGGALETAGGIARALPLLDDVFWVTASDNFVPGFRFDPSAFQAFADSDKLAHLWLVPNPPHHPRGDFGLANGLAINDAPTRYTYSSIALYRRAFFASLPFGNPEGLKVQLVTLLREAMDNGRVSAEIHSGPWTDVGTPERLAQLNAP